jgi:WD40 repeat protein
MPHPPDLKVPVPGLAQNVPPYYLTINQHSWHGLIVSSTWNGRALAGFSLAKTWFPVAVGPGPDDDTFTVWARTSNLHGEGRFFLLRFNPADNRTTVVPLTVNIAAGHTVEMLAISPDGKQLAVLSEGTDMVLTVFNLSTGAEQNWFSSTLAIEQNGFLSWSQDSQTVQYCLYDLKTKRMIYGLLDTDAPPAQLPAKPIPVQGYVGGAIISADGTLVISSKNSTTNVDNGTWWVAKFDTATGLPLGHALILGGEADAPIGWVSPDGSLAIMNVGGGKVRGLQVLGAGLDLRVGGKNPPGTGDGGAAW